jgi:processive 1,2-diacylglycerol beta-glucosyltransferase
MAKICFINEPNSGTGYHRIQVPFNNLHKDYKDLEILGTNAFSEEVIPSKFDIIVIHKFYPYEGLSLQSAKANNVKIIVDVDNWIKFPGDYGIDDEVKLKVEDKIEEALKLSDVIWTASEKLKVDLESLYPGKQIVYIPNAIDFKQPQFITQVHKSKKVRVGWMGGLNQFKDIKKLIIPFKKLLKHKNHQLILCGYSEDEKVRAYWAALEYCFTSGNQRPKDQYVRAMRTDTKNYALAYNLMDIVLAPMANDNFSACKSNIKILEAGAFNLPMIVSNVEPFREFINKGLVNISEGKWDKKIRDLISNPKRRLEEGKKLGDYVRENYNIQKVNKLRYESIKNILQ